MRALFGDNAANVYKTVFRGKNTPDAESRERGGEYPDLTRMIAYLVATASEDWSFVLDVCNRVTASEREATEAAKALRREFKYAEPGSQLAAAKLWVVLLVNTEEREAGYFLQQRETRKFLGTLEDVLVNEKTSPVVRERFLDVLAGATWQSYERRRGDALGALWRKVRPREAPDQGVPFDTEDTMFSPPMPPQSAASSQPEARYGTRRTPPPRNKPTSVPHGPEARQPPYAERNGNSSRSRPRVIPPEEEIRRMFLECKIERGNARLLAGALIYTQPGKLNQDLIGEWVIKCRTSLEFIEMQIPWATAGADRSREARVLQLSSLPAAEQPFAAPGLAEQTVEEQLLDELLGAHAALGDALRQYDDLMRVQAEEEEDRRARAISKKEVRMDRSQLQNGLYLEPPTGGSGGGSGGGSSSRSSTPSPTAGTYAASHHSHSSNHHGHPLPTPPPQNGLAHMQPPQQHGGPYHPPGHAPPPPLQPVQMPYAGGAPQQPAPAPAPAGPRGPRSPGANAPGMQVPPAPGGGAYARSRTPSPARGGGREHPRAVVPGQGVGALSSALRGLDVRGASLGQPRYAPPYGHAHARDKSWDDEPATPMGPSEKAKGKMRALEVDQRSVRSDTDELRHGSSGSDWSDSDDERRPPHLPGRGPVRYAYDAVAERHEQLIREGQQALAAELAADAGKAGPVVR